MPPKINKSKNNNIFENRKQTNFFKKEDDPKKIMQPKSIKSKNNGCGTAPGNLVNYILTDSYTLRITKCFSAH